MLHKPKHLYTQSIQKGSSLVLAIFILVVMSLLGAALLRMMTTNEETYAYEVLGTRAYNTAQTGAQRKLQQLFPLNTGLDSNMCTINDAFSLAHIEGLNHCSVEVDCLEVKHDNVSYFTITSIGQCEINGEATSRVVEVQAKSMN